MEAWAHARDLRGRRSPDRGHVGRRASRAAHERRAAPAPERLHLRTIAVEADRDGSYERDVLLSELLHGAWRVVDRFERDGRRYLLAGRPPASARALSRREREVLAHAVLGCSNKHTAHALGVSESTVCTQLRSALRRLGVETVCDVLRFVGRVRPEVVAGGERLLVLSWPIDELDPLASTSLSPAEAEVARMAIDGLSNRAISRRRGTSVRTVGNQMSSVLRKLGVGSRRELAARFAQNELDLER